MSGNHHPNSTMTPGAVHGGTAGCLVALACLAMGLTSLSGGAVAATYYVDDAAGNDAWTGTSRQAQQDGTGPWRSLRKAGLAALQPGDVLALKCDGVWHEPLTLIRSGAPGQPIRVRPYGDGCASGSRPTVDVSATLAEWRRLADGSYSTKPGFDLTAVFVDGVFLPPAQFPATGMSSAGALPPGLAPNPKRFLADKSLAGIGQADFVGALLRVRTQDWTIEEREIAGLTDEGALKLAADTEFPMQPGTAYYLMGKTWMLVRPGAWAYARETGELRLRLPGDAKPEQHRVQAPRAGFALQVAGASFVEVSGLRLVRSKQDAVMVVGSRRVTLEGLEVVDAGRDGISIKDSDEVAVANSAILRSQRDGVVVVKSRQVSITGNRVEETGTVGPAHATVAAINVDDWFGGAVVVTGNQVRNSGYGGIRFKRNAVISDNRVEQSCLVLEDCGAIYSWADNQSTPPLNSEVKGNTVIGTPASEADNPYRPFSSGIYLDDLTNGVRVIGNTVTGTDSGVHIHNGFNLVVEGNDLTDNRRNQIYLSMGHGKVAAESLSNNVIRNNTLRFGPTSLGVEIRSSTPAIRHAEFNGNRYFANGTSSVAFISEVPGRETQPPMVYDFERWRNRMRQEADGKWTYQQQAGLAAAVPVLTQDFRQGIPGWGAWSPDNSGAVRWKPNCEGIACMEIDSGRKVAVVYSKDLPLEPARQCIMHLRVRSDHPDNPLQVRLRRTSQPYAAVGLTSQILAGSLWTDYLLPFRTNRLATGKGQVEFKVNMSRTVQVAAVELSCQPK